MLHRLPFALRRPLGGAASSLAMVAALASGAAVTTALLESPAAAQSKPRYSRGFIAAYQPVAEIVNAEGGDYAAARAQLDAVHAAIENDDDRNAAGRLTLQLGSRLNDPALQRRGLEMVLASGKATPEEAAQFQFYIGNLAYGAGDWAAARTALEAAIAGGHTEGDPEALIAESYLSEGQVQQGLNYLSGVIEQRLSAGQPVPENWVLRGLRAAYEANLPAEAETFAALLVRQDPSAVNWQRSLQVINAMNSLERQVHLDLLRLMLETDAITTRRELIDYIEAADVRVMSNEVQRVLQRGIEMQQFTPSDEYYSEIKRIADERAPVDRREAPSLAAEARSAATGTAAQAAGDVFLSLEDYAQAEQMFALALEKGGVDRDRNLTRLGIAQVKQGKAAEAKANFEQVSGARAPVTRMWALYADSKMA